VDVLEVCGDLTEEDLEKQAEEIEKHKRRKVAGGEQKELEEGDDDVMNWTKEDFMRYDRYLEEMNKEAEEMRAARKAGKGGERERGGEKGMEKRRMRAMRKMRKKERMRMRRMTRKK
jgi:hypothetical protein